MIRARCPHCKEIFSAPTEHAGRVHPCPQCQKRVRLPDSSHVVEGTSKISSKHAAPAAAPANPISLALARLSDSNTISNAYKLPGEEDLPDINDFGVDPLPENCPDEMKRYGKARSSCLAATGWPTRYSCTLFLGGILLVAAFVGGSASYVLSRKWENDHPMSIAAGGLIWLLLLLGGASLAYQGASYWWRTKRTEAWACRDGIVWLAGKEWRSCRWSEVEICVSALFTEPKGSVYDTVLWGKDTPRYVYHLLLGSTRENAISIVGADDTSIIAFAYSLQRKASDVMLPVFLQRLEDGETIDCLAVQLTKTGLQTDNQLLLWENLTSPQIVEGELRLRCIGIQVAYSLAACSHALLIKMAADLIQECSTYGHDATRDDEKEDDSAGKNPFIY